MLGSGLKLALGMRYERWFLLLYLAMGWMVLFGLDSVIAQLQAAALILLLVGAVAYSGGTVFHVLDGRWRWGAAAWHGSVLLGSASHFIAIFRFCHSGGLTSALRSSKHSAQRLLPVRIFRYGAARLGWHCCGTMRRHAT